MNQNAFANTIFNVLRDNHNPTLEIAERYNANGWAVTPVQFKTKQPILSGWQHGGIAEDALSYYVGLDPLNIGIVLGEPSHGLVDIDIDDPLAIPFAEKLLPKTNCIFGRRSMPRSHWIYQVPGPERREAFVISGKTIIELRGNGHLTVFPGSVHPSGELIEFESGFDGDPGQTTWDDLKNAARKIAIVTLLSKRWTPGSRHALSLSVSGLLSQLGWTEDEVDRLVRLVATQRKDEEIFDRLNSVKTTFETAAGGRPISGRRELIELLGEDAVSAIERWHGATATTPSSTQVPTLSDIASDAGAADAFADARRDDLIFRDDTNCWFRRCRQVFRPISPVQVQGEAKQFMQERVSSAEPFAPTRSLLSKAKIDNLLKLSRHRFRLEPELFDQAKHLVGCEDGTILDLNAQSIVSETTSIVTKTLRCSFVPEADCPQFKAFLNQIFEDDQTVISFVQRAIGYSLSGYVSEQCFFLLVGKGSNGKSTFLSTLQNVFGDYAATTPAQTLMVDRYGNQQTNDLAKLVGIRFVTATETEKGQRLAESKIKRITGGDRIACRELYGHLFEYVPQFKLWLATNDPPEFSGGDESIARRIRVIEFPVTFDEATQDQQLPARLLNEAPGILNWALQGYVDWKQQGLNPPDQIKIATKSYRIDNDTVGQFIEACCIEDRTGKTSARGLHDAYKIWCFGSGLEPIPSTTFGKELKRHRFKSVKERSGNSWSGLRLKEFVRVER
jgi:putative DNA primase/helicase